MRPKSEALWPLASSVMYISQYVLPTEPCDHVLTTPITIPYFFQVVNAVGTKILFFRDNRAGPARQGHLAHPGTGTDGLAGVAEQVERGEVHARQHAEAHAAGKAARELRDLINSFRA